MSIAVLTQVYDEVRRLSIAGAVVAPGDFRLKKLIAPLEQAGAKAPVFAKVGQAVQAVVESTEKTSAAALLELSTLINAILYTQGETGQAGDLKPVETVDLGPQTTQASARVLKPLLEALSDTGAGRLELVKDAIERGAFKDLRLVKPALNALDDKYPEISQLVGTKVLPLYGKAILPELKAKFDMKGKGGNLRRLALMHKLDPEGTRPIVKDTLENGSKELKVVAIQCLGTADEDLGYLLEQSKAKAKDVRAAALKALAKMDAEEALTTVSKAIDSADLQIAIYPVRQSQNQKLISYVTHRAEEALDALFKVKDKKESPKQVGRVQMLLYCLQGRTDKPTETLLLKMFGKRDEIAKIKGDPGGEDLNIQISRTLASGSKAMREAIVNVHSTLEGEHLKVALITARRIWTPAEVYKQFSPYLQMEKKGKKSDTTSKRQAVCEVLVAGPYDHDWILRDTFVDDGAYGVDDDEEASQPKRIEWDPRWLDLAVEAEEAEVVVQLAQPGHKGAQAFLRKEYDRLLKKNDIHDLDDVLEALIRTNHPDSTDCLIEGIKKFTKGKQSWGLYWIARQIPDLPPAEALPKLEALLPSLDEKVVDSMIGFMEELRSKAAPPAS